MDLTLDQFAAATGAEASVAAVYFDHAVTAMERFSIDNPERIAPFLAHVSIETARLTAMEEGLYYKDAARLADLFRRAFDLDHNGKITDDEVKYAQRYIRNPTGLSMVLYRGFHGRGGAQLTWDRNYALHGQKLGYDYLGHPSMLLEPFHAMLTAASFWDEIKGNEVAGDMDELTRRWNGPRRLHLAERIAQRNVALTALA